MVAKTVKTPDFLRKNRESGAFCILWGILIYLQLFLPIFPNPVGEMATTSERKTVALSLGCAMGADLFPIAVWRKAGVFLEHLNEVVHIVDATVGSDLLNRQGG